MSLKFVCTATVAGLLAVPAFADPITLIAIDGQAAPDGNGSLVLSTSFYNFSLNDRGQVAYEADYSGLAQANVNRFALIVSDGSTDRTVVRGGALNPGEGFRRGFSPVINNAGQVASSIFAGPGSTGVATIGRFEADGTFTQIAQNGESSPGYFNGDLTNNQPYRQFGIVNGRRFLDMNERGDVGYLAELGVSTGSFPIANYLYTDQLNAARMTAVTRPPVAGQVTLSTLWGMSMNNNQSFSFDTAFRDSTVSPAEGRVGIARSARIADNVDYSLNFNFSGVTDSNQQLIPGYTPILTAAAGLSFSNINDNESVAFGITVENVNNSSDRLQALALADGNDSITLLVTQGDAVPSGTIRLLRSTYSSLNNFDQVAFVADVDTGSQFLWTLMVHDPQLGIVELVREGDSFLGSTITTIQGYFEINNEGTVAFQGRLADGRDFIGLAQGPRIPAPSTLACAAALGLMASRRRRG